MSLPERIRDLLARTPGLSDREIAELLMGPGARPQPVNALCRRMAAAGLIRRTRGHNGVIANWPSLTAPSVVGPADGTARLNHDAYGKRILARASGGTFRTGSKESTISFGARAGSAWIDGVIAPDIAVEIESRTAKQVRGAVLDLVCHPYPKKLLLLIPAHMNVDVVERQAEALLKRFVDPQYFRVVRLTGTAARDRYQYDYLAVREALAALTPLHSPIPDVFDVSADAYLDRATRDWWARQEPASLQDPLDEYAALATPDDTAEYDEDTDDDHDAFEADGWDDPEDPTDPEVRADSEFDDWDVDGAEVGEPDDEDELS